MAKDDADAPLETSDWVRLARPSLSAVAVRFAMRAWEPLAHGIARAGPMPEKFRFVPADPRRGDKDIGRALLGGVFNFGGAELETGGAQPWGLRLPNERFQKRLHTFEWLRDLSALAKLATDEGKEAGRTARRLTDGWIEGHSSFDELVWRPDIVGRRLLSWLTAAEMLTDGSDTIWKSRFYYALAVQTRFLARTVELLPPGPGRSTGLIGVLTGSLALNIKLARADRLKGKLVEAVKEQLLPDGGHISRSPAALLHLVSDLVLMRDAFEQTGERLPKELEDAFDAALPMLRFLHSGNGRLIAFHGGGADNPELIEDILGLAPAATRPFVHAPHSGYHRMDAGQTTVFIDSGAPPPLEAAHEAHASSTALEICSGGHPLVINCGPAPGSDPIEDRIARATAAHSTLTLGPGSSAHVLNGSLAGRLLGPRLVGGPAETVSQRHDETSAGYGGIWLDLAHEGYGPSHSARHVRRLYLQERGLDIRGEDRIEPIASGDSLPRTSFVLRFHIAPDVTVVPTNGEPGANLTLPSGEVWRFQCKGGDVRVEDSRVYGPRGARRTVQITVRGDCVGKAHSLKWAFRREHGPSEDEKGSAAHADQKGTSESDTTDV